MKRLFVGFVGFCRRLWRGSFTDSERIEIMEFCLFLVLFASVSLLFATGGYWLISLAALGIVPGLISARLLGADRDGLARAGLLGAALLMLAFSAEVLFFGA